MAHLLRRPLLALLTLLRCRTATAPFACGSLAGTYESGSVYEDNLKLLLSAMASQTPVNRYFISSRGDPPDTVYGTAVCTNMSSTPPCSRCADSQCKSCFDAAVVDALVVCPNMKIGSGTFNSCAMSWSNTSDNKIVFTPPPLTDAVKSPPPSPVPRRQDPPPKGNVAVDGAPAEGMKKSVVYGVAVAVAIAMGLAVGALFLWRRTRTGASPAVHISQDGQTMVFNYQVLQRATNNFAESNLLGRGGFGPVYKGVLPDGQQVAIKKLDTGSMQGIQELNNEVLIVTRLQHRNLVKVLGYCLQKEETMLVYELTTNSSLDKFLNNPIRSQGLAWSIRFKIIKGIGRGLLYLHEDSRLTIIHRDMKTSNILLDADMNPKISDFGLSKLFDDDCTHASTSRIVGTLGYMSPEYLTKGLYSTKSDVYSFGIIVLEIVTGRMINSFHPPGRGLANYVKKHWDEGRTLEVLDSQLEGVCVPDEVTTSLYIGLLCSQENVDNRPDMAKVVVMLSSPQQTNLTFD